MAADLKQSPGRSLVCAGARQGPAVHVLAHAINQALGNNGKTAGFIAPVQASFGMRQGTLAELAADLTANRVEVLFILDANPVYDAPADLNFAQALQQEKLLRELATLRGEDVQGGARDGAGGGLFSRVRDAFNGR